jgi:hypothetical protein
MASTCVSCSSHHDTTACSGSHPDRRRSPLSRYAPTHAFHPHPRHGFRNAARRGWATVTTPYRRAHSARAVPLNPPRQAACVFGFGDQIRLVESITDLRMCRPARCELGMGQLAAAPAPCSSVPAHVRGEISQVASGSRKAQRIRRPASLSPQLPCATPRQFHPPPWQPRSVRYRSDLACATPLACGNVLFAPVKHGPMCVLGSARTGQQSTVLPQDPAACLQHRNQVERIGAQ